MSNAGRPRLPIRLMASLLYLKHSGSVCSPAGTGALYAVNFANGQSVLQNSDLVTTAASSPISGVATDVTIISVEGQLGIYTGGSNGRVAKAPANLSTSAGVKQINWRDVPTTN